ncbi:MAG: mannitol dehydrogenase family protein [Deinococcus-Thermus bacterium]|jgi:fructuronate reductase|nr:mannitol dehydrogenase family protein [Deinococcota bacterium]
MTERLSKATVLPQGVARPRYDRAALTPGILHFGPGAFHRAHEAPITDTTLAEAFGPWGIVGVALRRPDVPDALNAQDGLYTLLSRGPEGTRARVVGSIVSALTAPQDPAAVLRHLADPAIRVVSLCITEKAYGIAPGTGGLDPEHPAIKPDLATPTEPSGAIGYLVEGLARRRAAGLAPFTPLSCDNLADNGGVLRRLVLEFADRRDPDLARWIEQAVPFPATMVDGITPAPTERTYADAARLIGAEDLAAVEAEPFVQWVIEDTFADGRPAWDKGGALFATDVVPYETMKLRMLNGTHSLMAYMGQVGGCALTRDVMADAALAKAVHRHMAAAAATLAPVPGIDLAAHADALAERFANPAVDHRTAQIAMDGTQKLPQRLLEPAVTALAAGSDADSFALAVAAWMRFCLGVDEAGRPLTLDDPRAGEIKAALDGVPRAAEPVAGALFALPGLFPGDLTGHPEWPGRVVHHLDRMLAAGVRAAAGG